ncbi:hypothetical protein RB614_42265 [Phytohabitans sp. ZYX-F-186]|uniref:Secreted protein n=1 Tax=Phytohabitans maris TaxID=3071409 RepID=A0ABU0ZY82_9ACTN|nr:hypothetical protein [Phytohabitans sp. ZYX-F-186]MDQ7911135.1 hypothetical protein [Phytohabitans sp. ZYX-F-186]
MKLRNVRRSLAVFGATAAAAVAVIAAPAPAQAHGGNWPGLLRLSPTKGSVNDNPMASYSATKACPADHRTAGMVALAAPDGTSLRLSGNFVPTAARPSGTLDTALIFTVLAGNLTTGYYEVDVLCFNAAFESVKADVNLIKIDVEAGTWKALI